METTAQAPTSAADRVVPGSTPHSDGAGAFVPVQTRSERPSSYDPADFGAPTGREVNWRYTPVARLSPLFSADAASGAPAVSHQIVAPDGIQVVSQGHDAAVRGEVFTPEDVVSATAWQRAENAIHLRIPQDAELDEPIRIDVVGTDAAGRGDAHVILEALPNSRAVVIVHHSGSAQYAQNVEIVVRDGATLEVVTVQRWEDDAIHAAAHQARVHRDATLRHVVVSFGGGLVRINPSVELAGPGARGELYGVSYADAGQHLESQVFLHHKGPNTVGDVLYKGALQGAGARSVWIGDVLIGPDATATDSYEANRNLVLTDGARADSVPNLEIETGEILGAGHASATGRFDDEQLFYLQARGIPEETARRLVVLGFLTEVVQKIRVPTLEADLIAAIEEELAR